MLFQTGIGELEIKSLLQELCEEVELLAYTLILGSDASLRWASCLILFKDTGWVWAVCFGKDLLDYYYFPSVFTDSECGLIKTCWVFNVGAC